MRGQTAPKPPEAEPEIEAGGPQYGVNAPSEGSWISRETEGLSCPQAPCPPHPSLSSGLILPTGEPATSPRSHSGR